MLKHDLKDRFRHMKSESEVCVCVLNTATACRSCVQSITYGVRFGSPNILECQFLCKTASAMKQLLVTSLTSYQSSAPADGEDPDTGRPKWKSTMEKGFAGDKGLAWACQWTGPTHVVFGKLRFTPHLFLDSHSHYQQICKQSCQNRRRLTC